MALRTPLSVTPHLYMGDSTGRPLDMGTVYFGEQDKDPEFYPIELFSDDALTLPLAQPVHTKGGYLYDKGDMVEPHAKELIYSVKVLDSYGRKVFYKGAMMRNSWNDDVIEQINTAIIGSADVARQVATDITNEAINNTAVEGGVLADTFVVVDGTLSQRTINRGLESIADLSTINNPKNGLRVYVKSYHAGLNKGGGYFIYDSTKSGTNNGGTIVNGWVRDRTDRFSVFDFGAKGDGVADDFNAITMSLSVLDYAYLPPKYTYLVGDEITVPQNSSVFSGSARAEVKANFVDKNVFYLTKFGNLSNINIFMKTGYSEELKGVKAAIRVPLGAPYDSNYCRVSNVEVWGSKWGEGSANNNGVGIYMGGSGGGEALGISYSVLDNVRIIRARTAIKLEGTDKGYVNSNTFSNCSINGQIRAFHLTQSSGGEVGANKFVSFNYNHSNIAEPAIYCNGNYNLFSGFFYDMYQGSNPQVVADFVDKATFNRIDSTNQYLIVNDVSSTKLNFMNGDELAIADVVKEQLELPSEWLTLNDTYALGYGSGEYKPYLGHQDNILAFADKLHSVTFNGFAGSRDQVKIFNPFRKDDGITRYTNPMVIEITLATTNLSATALDFIQIVFGAALVPSSVKIELYIDSKSQYETVLDVTNNTKRVLKVRGSTRGIITSSSKPTKIKVTMSNTGNAEYQVRSIVGRYLVSAGNAFMQKDGGLIVGDLDFLTKDIGVTLVSPNGSRWRLTVDDEGIISASNIV